MFQSILLSTYFNFQQVPEEYAGESSWIGRLGQLLIISAFILAIASIVFYILAERHHKKGTNHAIWTRQGRLAFILHTVSVISTFGLLLFMIIGQYYEYDYVYQHSSSTLPLKYVISAFWEGQEGSFLLWIFWHGVLGLCLIRWARNWEAPTMLIVSIAQALLLSMVLGIHVGSTKVGINPFLLLREKDLILNENYLEFVSDGKGLNALLQNYWMVIHPPVLFLGFASTIVPFAFVLGAIWRGDQKAWIPAALPWTLFSAGALGTGIFMGGAWAYESLSFGGFWAWDPVENASLVPWLFIIAGLHTLLIARYTGRQIGLTYLLLSLGFILVAYSTYLTRSGVLTDTSVHSFVSAGLNQQLIVFLALIILPSLGLVVYGWMKSPKVNGEEDLLSREFWLFVGSILFSLSAAVIAITTSFPVINKILGTEYSITDPEEWYNNSHIMLGILMAILAAFSQFLVYKVGRPIQQIRTVVFVLLPISILLSVLIGRVYSINIIMSYTWGNFFSGYWLLLWAGILVSLTNFYYILALQKHRWKTWGSSLSHIGFGVLLVGIIISQYKQKVMTKSQLSEDSLQAYFFEKNITDVEEQSQWRDFFVTTISLEKNQSKNLEEYEVKYLGNYEDGIDKRFFEFEFTNPKTQHSFTVEPYWQKMDEMGNPASNPGTEHFLMKDVFTTVGGFTPEEVSNVSQIGPGLIQEMENNQVLINWSFNDEIYLINDVEGTVSDTANSKKSDTLQLNNGRLIWEKSLDDSLTLYLPLNGSYEKILKFDWKADTPIILQREQNLVVLRKSPSNSIIYSTDVVLRNSAKIDTFDRVNIEEYTTQNKEGKFRRFTYHPENNVIETALYQPETVRLEAIAFPQIKLIWLGGILMMGGLLLSAGSRFAQRPK